MLSCMSSYLLEKHRPTGYAFLAEHIESARIK